jgi:membrane fusion protein, multidrug efflux system
MKLKYCVAASLLLVLSTNAFAENAPANKKAVVSNEIAKVPAVTASKPKSAEYRLSKDLVGDEPSSQANIITETTNSATINTVRVLLVPDKETIISSTLAARIVTFNGTLGRSFKAGETLVVFDCEEARARVEMSRAELAGAIEQHEAKVKMQGLEQASDVEVALAASASNKAKAQLNLNQAQVSQCKINAPWSGRVAKTNVKNHMTVTPGQPLMELVNDGLLKLKLNLPSKLLTQIKNGTKFNISIDETGQSYPASISAINSRVDPVSQTVEVEAKLTKSYRELLAGMSGVASF